MRAHLVGLCPVFILVLAASCSSGGSATPAPDGGSEAAVQPEGGAPEASPEAGVTTLSSLTVSSGDLRPVFSAGVTSYDITSLNSLYPVTVTASPTDNDATLTINGSPATGGVASTFTPKVNEDITVVVSNGGASQTYTVRYVPSDLLGVTTTTTPQAGSEDLLLSTVSLNPAVETYAIVMDRAGNYVYYRTFLQQEIQDFQQYKLASGATVYACTVGEFNPAGWTLGVDHVMDDKFNDLTDIQILPYAQHPTLPAEAHDFVMLDANHWIAMTYVQRTVDLSKLNPAWSSQAPVMNAIVQEVNSGSVVGEWDSGNEMELYTDSVDGNAFGSIAVSDYLHLNSVTVDPADGNWILSFRHLNAIVKVDHTTAKILWTLGGKEDMFGLTADQAFSHQHHVRVQADGSLTVFDNGNDAHQSRAISFVLDETNHKVTSFQVLAERPLADPQTGFMGSVTPLPQERLLVGWGGWFTTQTAPAGVEYVNGQVAWSFQFDGPIFSYRALPITAL
jgi:hypothetical protein